MPILKNTKQESFCQFRATGKTQTEAYALAGYKPSEHHAARLARNGKIADRIAELQARAATRAEETVESMAAQYDEDRAHALKLGQISAAVQATTGKAKLFGLFVEKSTVSVTHNYAMMTEEELRFEIAAIHAEARALKAGVKH